MIRSRDVVVRKKDVIKISGDLLRNAEILNFIASTCKEVIVVAVAGGGDQVGSALLEKDLNYQRNETGVGRRLDDPGQEDTREAELYKNRDFLIKELSALGIKADKEEGPGVEVIVITPYDRFGGVRTPFDADQLAIHMALSPDVRKVHICTLPKRVKGKEERLAHLMKGLEDKVAIRVFKEQTVEQKTEQELAHA